MSSPSSEAPQDCGSKAVGRDGRAVYCTLPSGHRGRCSSTPSEVPQADKRSRITRGTPIEKLPLTWADVTQQPLRQKINEIIDRLNAMNEVSQ